MTVTIELPPEKEAALLAKARLRGLTLEQWLLQLAENASATKAPLQAAADIVLRRMRDVSAEEEAILPADGASQHDHYIYGTPKREQ